MTETVKSAAKLIAKIIGTDRWALLGCDGDMGEGKSCLTSQLAAEVATITNTRFTYDGNMTYMRSELKMWIDGDKDGMGQKPKKSAILADEIISMFFKRNWYDSEQIDGIELLNKCRDRNLAVFGNVPNFWDLDSAFHSAVTLWLHVHKRGVAWLMMKDDNPWCKDKWHINDNKKIYAKFKNPYKCKGFVCEIHFDDWSAKDKIEYYRIRNKKRVNTEGQRGNEKYRDIKKERDNLIRYIFDKDKKMKLKDVQALVPFLSKEAIRLIKNNQR